MNVWVLIADGSSARLFNVVDDRTLTPLRRFAHAESRAKSSELVTDRPGRLGKGFAELPISSRTAPKKHELEKFARELAAVVSAGAGQRSYDALALVAPPHFLGLLREGLDPQATKRLIATLDTDLASVADRELAPHLVEVMNAIAAERVGA